VSAQGGKLPKPGALPRDAVSILKLAARSMFDLFSRMSQRMMLVDRSGRVAWINESYKKFLPALGFEKAVDFVGRPVEEVVPNTLMRRVRESGKPILVDLLTNKAGTFVVSRIPLRDESEEVIGVLGMVLFDHPETTLQPLIAKFAKLQHELDAARKELAARRRPKYNVASFIGSSPAALEAKRQARRAAQAESNVLLLGEAGTAKELLAHAIHAASARADKPFIGVNLAAVPETLLEAKFFGVAPGAYTGAERKGRDGKFKLVDGGTPARPARRARGALDRNFHGGCARHAPRGGNARGKGPQAGSERHRPAPRRGGGEAHPRLCGQPAAVRARERAGAVLSHRVQALWMAVRQSMAAARGDLAAAHARGQAHAALRSEDGPPVRDHPHDYDLWGAYDRIDVPTLCLRDEASDLLLRETADEMRTRGARAVVVTIPNCGHAPALNVPEQLDLVERLLAG